MSRVEAHPFEPLLQPAPGTVLRRVRIKPDWLRVRDAPTTQGSRVLLELPGGAELIVLEERAGWLRIARPAGWVSADYVRDTGLG
ncbi:MAG TPA: SH3 domain-containing protein [Anaerolineae bacterium]|nr:SH3 domain-containing protein [Anaerolineae bacterium]